MSDIQWWKVGEPEATATKHRGRSLELVEGVHPPAPDAVKGTSLWMEGNAGENELSFQRTLLLEGNQAFLRALAGVPCKTPLVFAAREVGGAGSIDVAALFKVEDGNEQVLLLVDCKDAKPRGRRALVKQCSQAYRLAQAAFPNIVVTSRLKPSQVKLVLLAGVGSQAHLPEAVTEMPRPGWCVDGRFETIPAPRFLGYLPVRIGTEDWLALQELSASANEAAGDLWLATWAQKARTRRSNDKGEALAPAPARFRCLQVKAADHAAALTGDRGANEHTRAMRRLLDDGRRGDLPAAGWRYAGETNDKGFVRLWWERLPGAEDRALEVYVSGRGVDIRTMDT